MKTHSNHLGDNTDLETVSQYIAEQLLDNRTIKGHGRVGHGMNGKDADLDNGGQCVVEEITIIDPVKSKTMFIKINLLRYASICTPTHEDEDKEIELQQIAEEIVMCADEYSGEWTGSDYWSFNHKETILVELSVEEYEEPNLELLADRCADAIYNSEEGKQFEEFATNLNNSIENLE